MSLNLYLDDCAYDKRLAKLLRDAGHTVVIPAEVNQSGAPDTNHFQFAITHGLVLITKNPSDFEELHQANPIHPGILAIHQDNDKRDMSHQVIVRAISNLEAAGVLIAGQFIPLNAWRY